MEPEARIRKRRAWAANIAVLGVGMVIGGSVDIGGPGGGMLVVGFLVALCGGLVLLFIGQ
jgi:hypothetical protein